MSDEESFAELSMSDEEEEMFTSVIEPKSPPVQFTVGEENQVVEEEESCGESSVSDGEVESIPTLIDAPLMAKEDDELVAADDGSSVRSAEETATEETVEEEPATLYEEAANNQLEVVASLVALPNVDIDAVDSAGDTALLLAVRNNHAHIVALLLEHGADTQLGSDTTPLHEAVKHNHSHLVQMLLLGGADSNAVDGYGLTPLYYTVELNRVELVRALLLAGASPTGGARTSALDAARNSPHSYLTHLLESAVEKQEAEPRVASPPCIRVY